MRTGRKLSARSARRNSISKRISTRLIVAHSKWKLAGLTIHDAASFSEACKRSAAYAATVQCAVSAELRAALAVARAAR
jgi:hypothetical protein